ncbi:hypothetical protein JG688_00007436 [Phytophthora aleatoria]|uniref:non-specific serine/threonine protein kinase n=1 Tax=Phytophthora aleatoria TaxID=2496075 RepID=A0A8J5IL28_9STRA|nr:hypothetical protein JG688_00007436 [Phytophthora aleatoria]
MPAGPSVVRQGSSVSAHDTKLSISTCVGPKSALTAEISSDNQEIVDAEDYITGASRGGYASSIISSEGSSDSSEERDAIDAQDVTQFSAAELQDQIGQQFVEGINPYVEQHTGDEEDFYVEDFSSSEEDESNTKHEKTTEEKEKEFTEWENPSYLVKDLDTGESYRVEEIDQQFTLVTLDSVAAQHEHKEEQQQGEEATESTSSYLLSLYTADETADIEIEDDLPKDAEPMSTGSSMRARSSNMSAIYAPSDELPTGPPVKCSFPGCTEMHQRVSGYCADHEMIAREEEDSRAQALYLIPSGARAEFIKIGSHGFAYDASNRLYTVYAIEMRCVQSGAMWVIYRRYQQFKELNDRLRPMGVRVPLLPPKKLLGSFEPDFIAKRQSELSNWLRCLLNYDRVDQSAKNPHLVEEVRKFLTSKADQPPLLLDRLPLKRSRFFGASLADDGDEENNRLSTGKQNVSLQDFRMIQVIGRGSFGKVVLVGHKTTKKLYAMKMLSKENIVKRKQVEHTRTERRVLGCTRHPFIVGLHYAFQTAQRLYFVLDYCPGEILDRLGHGTAVDWWNLGMVLYEMLTGLPPWYTNDRKKLFERLRSARLHFPPYVSRRAEALIRQLLNRNPAERLGSKGAHHVKNHLFFESIDWAKLAKKQVNPPFRPCHSAMNDGEAPLNFEAEFTRLPLPSAENAVTSPHSGRGLGALGTRLRRDSDTFKDFTYESPGYLESVAKKEEA